MNGPALDLRCATCGEPRVADDVFCEACGASLTAPPAGPAATDPPDAADPAAPAPTPAPDPAVAPPAPAGEPCVSCGATGEVADGYCGVCGMKQPAPRDHVERTHGPAAGVSDRGRRHHRNEDAMGIGSAPGLLAAVVCDGVSTTVSPDVASAAAVSDALAVLLAGGDDHERLLVDAHRAAVRAVSAVPAPPHPDLDPPSCTFLAAVVDASHVTVGGLGDCRAYWLAGDGRAELLTHDDSWAHTQIRAGMPADQARADPRASVITRWVGGDADPSWTPTITSFSPPAPGHLLLCSDGLWNYTTDPATLEAHWDLTDGPLGAARRLVDLALDGGGHDNVTVVVVPAPLSPEPQELTP